MTAEEAAAIEASTGRPVANSLRLTGPHTDLDAGYRCPLLSPENRCTVYERRPLICRIWGLTEDRPCPHGCTPERYLSTTEAFHLFRKLGDPVIQTASSQVLAHMKRQARQQAAKDELCECGQLALFAVGGRLWCRHCASADPSFTQSLRVRFGSDVSQSPPR